MAGRLELVDLTKAASSLGEGAQINLLDEFGNSVGVFQVHNGNFVSVKNKDCMLQQRSNGDIGEVCQS